MLIIKINTVSETPIYTQIKNQIIVGIAKGLLKDGDKIPTIRQLAEDTGINMLTVKKAYSILKDEGYIEIDRRHGAKIKVRKEPKIALNKFKNDLEILICELALKGVKKEEVLEEIEKIFSNLKI